MALGEKVFSKIKVHNTPNFARKLIDSITSMIHNKNQYKEKHTQVY